MIHALITAGLCLIVFFLPEPKILYTVASIVAGFYIGREIAQAEYRYIENYCNKKRANMPWWAPFTSRAWTLKSIFDWILPCIVAAAFVIVRMFFYPF